MEENADTTVCGLWIGKGDGVVLAMGQSRNLRISWSIVYVPALQALSLPISLPSITLVNKGCPPSPPGPLHSREPLQSRHNAIMTTKVDDHHPTMSNT